MQEEVAVLDPQDDADASPDDRFADDKSVDTSAEATEELVEVDAETDDTEEEVESEADSSPADEENVEETIDAKVDTDEKYGAEVKGRIDELTSKWRDSERNNASMSQELEALRKQVAEQPDEIEPFKSLADFEYDDAKYQHYLGTEIDRRATAAAEKVGQNRDGKNATQKAYDDYFAKEKEFSETVKDYKQLVNNPELKISPDMAFATQVVMQDPAMVYYLANNKDVAERLHGMGKDAMLIEMGSIREKMATEKAKSAKKVSDAPPPVPKVKGGDPGRRKKITDADLSDAEFNKMRRKQIANR